MTETVSKPDKPLGIKSYGSIPHLPGSRLGPGDHKCHEGQERICLANVRDRHDTIIVQEKLDGSNVGVARIGGVLVALGRAGYRAETSPYEQHVLFAAWVNDNRERFDFLADGERVCGEWLAQAHGTRYRLFHDPFVPFDIIRGQQRLPFAEFRDKVGASFKTPTVLSISAGACCPLDRAIQELGDYGHHGAVDKAEGVVYRVERKGKVDFLAKYVHPWKVDGGYLPEISGKDAVWNWRPPAR
jgi:hypothetical protein